METEPRKPFKIETLNTPKSLKMKLKSLETFEISESSQMKKQNTKTITTPKRNKNQTHKD